MELIENNTKCFRDMLNAWLNTRYESARDYAPCRFRCDFGWLHHKRLIDTQKVKTVQKLTPKQASTENQIRSTALERPLI